MSVMSKLHVYVAALAVAVAACSSETEDLFSNTCPGGAVALPDGGCPPVVTASGGAIGTGGASTGGSTLGGSGGASAGAGGASATGGGGSTSIPDAAPPPGCPVNGGGPSRTPPGACTVLAYCNQTEFRLVCRDGEATCDCRTRGVTMKTIPNDRDYCESSDAGARENVAQANTTCGWNLDMSTWQ